MLKVGSFSSMFEAPLWIIYVDRENLRVKILSDFTLCVSLSMVVEAIKSGIYLYMCSIPM